MSKVDFAIETFLKKEKVPYEPYRFSLQNKLSWSDKIKKIVLKHLGNPVFNNEIDVEKQTKLLMTTTI